MTLPELKKKIEDKTFEKQFLIFECGDSNFIATQYYREFAKNLNLAITPIDDLSEINRTDSNLFGADLNNSLFIYRIEEFKFDSAELANKNNLIIICNKVEKDTKKIYNNFIINFPKLEEWQIVDYIRSTTPGLSDEDAKYLVNICKKDINLVQNELNKINIFGEKEQTYLFKKFIEDGLFSNLTQNTIFNFINAVVKKDINSIKSMYKELKIMDASEMGILVNLYNNFKSIINIQLNPAATAESCGLKPNQFWAMKYNINFYNREQLTKIFSEITDLDIKIKTGEIDTSLMIDYLLIKILSV